MHKKGDESRTPPPADKAAVTEPRERSRAVISPGINVNVQIHIAADATSETIEEIFKNMRRYVLGSDGATAEE